MPGPKRDLMWCVVDPLWDVISSFFKNGPVGCYRSRDTTETLTLRTVLVLVPKNSPLSRLERDDICRSMWCSNQDPLTKTIIGFVFVMAHCHLMILDAVPQKSMAFRMADSTPPSLCSLISWKTAEPVYFKSDSDCTWLLHPSSSLAHLHFY